VTSTDEIEVQTFHSLVCEVESTSLTPGGGQDSLYNLFPASIRSCIKAFAILRKWLISKIAFLKLGNRPRQSRLERLLQALEISRIRNSDSTPSTPISEKPCVRSFVEAVLTSALLSPESRMYSRAWQSVANSRRTTSDSFSALLDSSNVQMSTGDSLLVDIGWLFERILEVIAMPNVITQPVEEAQGLVNFEKRRYDGSPLPKSV
jgi:GTPase-activating protein BEM2